MWFRAVVDVLLLSSGLVVLAGCASAPSGPVRPATEPAAIDEARRLMSERRCRGALAILNSLPEPEVRKPDTGYLIGECHYRTSNYPAAIAQFDEVLAAHPEFFQAYPRRWTAMLARNPETPTRRSIEDEIESLTSRYPLSSEAEFAAYEGYALLRRSDRRRTLIMRLANRILDAPLRDAVAAALLEEMIRSPDSTQKHDLAALYLKRFGATRGARLAARVLVRLDGDLFLDGPDSVRDYRRRFPDNRHLDQAIAGVLVGQGRYSSLAERLARGHLRSQRRARDRERRWYRSDEAWQILARWERAESELLLAVMRGREGRIEQAERDLRRAAESHPEPARVYAELYTLLETYGSDRAAGYLRRALEHGRPDSRREASWAQQVRASTPGVRNPRADLALRSGVPLFDDVTVAVGLDDVRATRVAWGDFDNDGYDDVLLAGPRLYRNVAGRRFAEVTDSFGLDRFPTSTGGAWVDADNDGRLDLLLLHRDGVRLLHNDSGSGFRDVTDAALPRLPAARAEAFAWGDMDNDGWLDLYVANYETGAERGTCAHDRLFRNRRDGTFADATAGSGLVTEEPLCGRGAQWLDVDDDGRQDILVTNYRLHPNLLWVNVGNNRFEERAYRYSVRGHDVLGAFGHTIAAAAGDIDGDGRTDLYLSNLAHPRYLDYSDRSVLLRSMGLPGDGLVTDPASGNIPFDETSAEPVMADFDNDGDLDLYITSVYRGRWSRFFGNDGGGRFTDWSWLSGTRVENSWGTGVADFDNDGDLDLLVGSEQGVRLLRNRGNGRHWLSVRVRSAACNRFGIGARVRVRAGQSVREQTITAGRGTGSQDSATAHFGLDSDAGTVDVEVIDLCGYRAARTAVAPDRLLEIRLGS